MRRRTKKNETLVLVEDRAAFEGPRSGAARVDESGVLPLHGWPRNVSGPTKDRERGIDMGHEW
jgi:hypothetical protein